MTPRNDWSFINWDPRDQPQIAVEQRMNTVPACTGCKAELPPALINLPDFQECPSCKSRIRAEVFPAYFRAPERGSAGEALVLDSHASCFYHPQKQAAVVCAACGRFICSLCDVELEGQHLCPPCLELSHKGGKLKSIEARRVLNDTIALHLVLLSVLIFYISFITAPLALYWAIKHRKSPTSIVRRSRLQWYLAVILSSLIILGWIGVVVAILFFRSR
jgi:hypothetical protein